MKIKFFITCFIVFAFSMMFTECTKSSLPDPEICFESEVLPLLRSNCTQSGCHNNIDRKSGIVISDYYDIIKLVDPGHYKTSELYQVIVSEFGNKMPPKPYDLLNNNQIQTIALWIKQGAQNTTNCAGACDTSNVSFNRTIFPMLQTYCNGCHGGSSPQGNVSLSNYGAILEYVNDNSLVGSVNFITGYSRMPKDGIQLSSCQLSQIDKWIADGAPNN